MELAIEYYGGGLVTTLAGGATHVLGRWMRSQHLVVSGGVGNVAIKMPQLHSDWVLGGPYWSIVFQASGTDIEFRDWEGNLINVYDPNGNAATFIDVSDTATWGAVPAVRVFLESATDGGVWRVLYWELEP